MGCDIHINVEVRKNGIWNHVKKLWGTWDNDINTYKEIYESRNYILFALLANVRNQYNLTPISQPKGLPKDITISVKEESNEWGTDGHSHSWLTLKELIEFNWENEFLNEGCVNAAQFKDYLDNGKPSSWCRGVGLVSVETPTSTRNMIENYGLQHPFLEKTYTVVSWSENYKSYCSEFFEKTIPKLKELGKPEDVRIVFWFDS